MKRIIVLFALILFLLPSVFAAANFEVTAFSCSPNEVKVSEQFSCTATVQNSGDASGTLNTATLYSDSNNWLESSSYSVTVNTAVNSGASTDVTFTGLKATKSGNSGFARIMLDQVTDTYVASAGVNVNAINVVVTDSASSSSAASNANVDVTAQGTAGGNVDVRLSFAVSSGGCSIGSQASSATTNDMSDGQTTSHTWTVTMGTSNCAYTVTALATSNPAGTATKTDSESGTITCSSGCSSSSDSSSSSSSSGGGGGAGGGGAASGNESIKSQLWTDVAAGSSLTMSISNPKIDITSIVISVKNALKNFKLTVTGLNVTPKAVPEFDGIVHQYIEIVKNNAVDADIESAVIKFSVKKSWVEENSLDPAGVGLYRFVDGKWEKLSTKFAETTDSNYKYEATSSGFSYFVVAAEKSAVVRTIQEEVPQEVSKTSDDGKTDIQKEQEKRRLGTDVFMKNGWNIAIIGAIVGLVLFVGGYVIYQKRKVK